MKKLFVKGIAVLLSLALISCSSEDSDSDDFPSAADVNALVVDVSIPERKGENPFKNFIGKNLKRQAGSFSGDYYDVKVTDDTFTVTSYSALEEKTEKYEYEYSYDENEKKLFGKVKSYSSTEEGETISASSAGEYFEKELKGSDCPPEYAEIFKYTDANFFNCNISYKYEIRNGKLYLHDFFKTLMESSNASLMDINTGISFANCSFNSMDFANGTTHQFFITKDDGQKFSGVVLVMRMVISEMKLDGAFEGTYDVTSNASGDQTVKWKFTNLPSDLASFKNVECSSDITYNANFPKVIIELE